MITEAWGRTIDFLRFRKKAYQQIPHDVLVDLAKFCRANESCVIPGDHDRSLLLAGRYEVWLRIQQHLNYTSEQLAVLYSGGTPKPKEGSK